MASLGICLPCAERGFASFLPASPEQHARPAPPPVKTYLSPDDGQFLDDLERTSKASARALRLAAEKAIAAHDVAASGK